MFYIEHGVEVEIMPIVGRHTEVGITRRYFGTDDKPDRFVILTIRPRE